MKYFPAHTASLEQNVFKEFLLPTVLQQDQWAHPDDGDIVYV